MKISAVASAANTIQGSPDPQVAKVQSVRSLRMNTNATPGLVKEAPPAEELTIPNPNEAEPAVEDTQPLSPQLAAIAKQKRALQVKEREIADREKALLAQSSTQEGGVDLARLKSDPLGVLLEAGVTYQQLTDAVLASQDGGEIRALQKKIEDLEKGIDQRFTDKDTQAEEAVLNEMVGEAGRIVTAEPDAFELVKATESLPAVRALIKRVYKTEGTVLEVREALQMVEDELFDESLKLAGLKKVQSKLQPEQAAAPQTPQQRQMRTLTNRDTAAPALSRKERALLAFAGNLKK